MKLLYVFDKGANCQYWEKMLPRMVELTLGFEYHICRLKDYLAFDQDAYDVLVYQTFPDDRHPTKYNRQLIPLTDKQFLKFRGTKILMDSRDQGEVNGFERFGGAFPRIKHVAGKSYCQKYTVLFPMPSHVPIEPQKTGPLEEKKIRVHCGFNQNGYPHTIRKDIARVLYKQFRKDTSLHKIEPLTEYRKFLQTTLISVTAPGFGETSNAAYYSLEEGACLLAHEEIAKIQLLPNADLVDGEDYVTFNLGNLDVKLRSLLTFAERAKHIGKCGREKFYRGMDLDESCRKMIGAIKGLR